MKNTLKPVSIKARKVGIISVLRCRVSLIFGLDTSQVEETTIKMILNSNTVRWVEMTERQKSYSNQEQVDDDWGKNTALLHSLFNRKDGGLRTSHDNLRTIAVWNCSSRAKKNRRVTKFA